MTKNKIILKNAETGEEEKIENQWPSHTPDETLARLAIHSLAYGKTSERWRKEKLFPQEVLDGKIPIMDMPAELKETFGKDVIVETKNWELKSFED